MKIFFGILFLAAQFGNIDGLPPILTASFKSPAPIHAAKRGEVVASFTALKDYAIDRTPPMTLKLTSVPGVTIGESKLVEAVGDRNSKEQFYKELPKVKVSLTVAKPGQYIIPGKLTYFFCNEKDGFCSRQILDVKIPVVAQ